MKISAGTMGGQRPGTYLGEFQTFIKDWFTDGYTGGEDDAIAR